MIIAGDLFYQFRLSLLRQTCGELYFPDGVYAPPPSNEFEFLCRSELPKDNTCDGHRTRQ